MLYVSALRMYALQEDSALVPSGVHVLEVQNNPMGACLDLGMLDEYMQAESRMPTKQGPGLKAFLKPTEIRVWGSFLGPCFSPHKWWEGWVGGVPVVLSR